MEDQAPAWAEGRDWVSGAGLPVAELRPRELGQPTNLAWPLRLNMDEMLEGSPCRQGLAAGTEGSQGRGWGNPVVPETTVTSAGRWAGES